MNGQNNVPIRKKDSTTLTKKELLQILGPEPWLTEDLFSGPTRYYLLDENTIKVFPLLVGQEYTISPKEMKKALYDMLEREINNPPPGQLHILKDLDLEKKSLDQYLSDSEKILAKKFNIKIELLDGSEKSLDFISSLINRQDYPNITHDTEFIEILLYVGKIFIKKYGGEWSIKKIPLRHTTLHIVDGDRIYNPFIPLFDELLEYESINPDIRKVLGDIFHTWRPM